MRPGRGTTGLAALAIALLPAVAQAEPTGVPRVTVSTGAAPGAAAVDVADLPPLPAASEEPSSSATVLAAASVEEDVVVGAAKREQSLGNVASAVTVVSGDRIRRFGYRTVGEALSGVAGMYMTDNRISNSVGIRGLQVPGDFNTRVLVLVDGASVNEPWGGYGAIGYDSFVSIDDIARIELIRGPVSSVYGASAFFGIINIVTRGAAETPRAWARASVNSVHGIITSTGFAAGDVHQQLRGTFQLMNRFGDTTSVPEIDPNVAFKSDASSQYAASIVGTYGGSFAQVRAARYRRDAPWAPYNGDIADPDPYQQYDNFLLLEGGHTREISKRLTVAGRGYANLYRFSDHINQNNFVPFDDIGDGRTFGAELRGRYDLVVPQRLGVTAGTEVSYIQTQSKSFAGDGSTDVTVPKNFSIQGVYAELDGQPTSWLGFTSGVRFDNHTALDSRVSPRAALFIAKPEKYGLKLLYAEGFRNPSAFEAFFHDDVSFSAPVGLHAETIRSFETVLWAKPIPGLSTRFSGFYWDARRIVEQLADPMNANLLQFQNVGRFVSTGLEVEGSYRNSQGWYAFGGGTFAHVGSADTGTDLHFGDVPNAPQLTASGGVSTPQLFHVAHVSSELIYIGERATRADASGNPSPVSPGWVDWNVAIYAPKVYGFDITAGARNLIGKRDLLPAPGDYDRLNPDMSVTTIARVPGEGREVYVKVGYSY